MKKKLFVLSMDAMVHEDVAVMMTKPNFARIMSKRAEVGGVRSVYPASTYPAHTTLSTGCYPAKHGVWANMAPKIGGDGIANWPLHHTYIDVEDLFAAAKRAGRTTAAVFWPITACNPNIDHVINEYFFYYPQDAKNEDDVIATFRAQGADDVAIRAVKENLHLFPWKGPDGKHIDRFDNFINGCTCSLIRNAKPDVLLIHNCHLDSTRHATGVFSEALYKALDVMDAWLGDIIAAMEDAGTYDDTDFVILSDHGQRDYTRTVKLNFLLERGGFLSIAPNGTIYDWRAYAKSNGQSAMIYLINEQSEKLYNNVKAYLEQLKEEGTWGISEVLTREELKERYGQCGPYSFMLEAVDFTDFSGQLVGELITEYQTPRAGHGYQPEKGPQPIFLAHGPSFKDGAFLEKAELADIAPTLATVLGESLPEAEGRVLHELLK